MTDLDLARHLSQLSRMGLDARIDYGSNNRQAVAIKADPQRHIDALVEAGVLRSGRDPQGRTVYRVIPPHQHDWRQTSLPYGQPLTVQLTCVESNCPYQGTPKLVNVQPPDERVCVPINFPHWRGHQPD